MTTTVLAVDDVDDNRQLLTDVLGRAGFAVLTASGGRQALDRAAATAGSLAAQRSGAGLLSWTRGIGRSRRSA